MAVVYASSLSFTNGIGVTPGALEGSSLFGVGLFLKLEGAVNLFDSTLFKTLALSNIVYKPATQALSLSNSIRTSLSTSFPFENHVLFDNDVAVSLSLTNTVYIPVWKTISGLNELETKHVFTSLRFVMYATSTKFVVKNFHGNALRGYMNIRKKIFTTRFFKNGLVTQPATYRRLRGFLHLHDDRPPEALQYEHKVMLDGDRDVTGLIESLNISYAIEQFCGEITINWADYSIYAEIDIADIRTTYGQERIEVFTRLIGETDWVSQGKFYLEKRNLSASYERITPTSWGRTKSALLSGPYSYTISRTWLEDTSAQVIVEEMAALAGVTVYWEVVTFPVLGGNLTVDGVFPIDVISQLASAVGGVFVPNKDGSLRVIPRFEGVQ
jgi:hypothetical protein